MNRKQIGVIVTGALIFFVKGGAFCALNSTGRTKELLFLGVFVSIFILIGVTMFAAKK